MDDFPGCLWKSLKSGRFRIRTGLVRLVSTEHDSGMDTHGKVQRCFGSIGPKRTSFTVIPSWRTSPRWRYLGPAPLPWPPYRRARSPPKVDVPADQVLRSVTPLLRDELLVVCALAGVQPIFRWPAFSTVFLPWLAPQPTWIIISSAAPTLR